LIRAHLENAMKRPTAFLSHAASRSLSRVALPLMLTLLLTGTAIADKKCPKCGRRYGDATGFCTRDGSGLVRAAPPRREGASSGGSRPVYTPPPPKIARLTVTPVGVAGAQIYIDGKLTPNGSFSERLGSRNSTSVKIKVTAAGYRTYEETVSLTSGNNRLRVPLMRAEEISTRAMLTIEVSPENAKVAVDGKTITDGNYEADLKGAGSKTVTVEVTADGHKPYREKITLKPGLKALPVALAEVVDTTATLDISVSAPGIPNLTNAIITVDGQPVKDGKFKDDLGDDAIGKDVEIKVVAAGYEPKTLSFTLDRGTNKASVGLVPLPDTKARLEVVPNVASAVVTINGKPAPTKRYEVDLGVAKTTTVEVQVTADGYKPLTQKVTLDRGKPQRFTATLVPIDIPKAVLSVSVKDTKGLDIPEAIVRVNGKAAEKGLYQEDLEKDEEKTVDVTVEAPNFEPFSTKMKIKSGSFPLEVTLKRVERTFVGSSVAEIGGAALTEAGKLREGLKENEADSAMSLVAQATAHRGGPESEKNARTIVDGIKDKGMRNSAIAYISRMLSAAGRTDEAKTLLDEIKDEEDFRKGQAQAAYAAGLARKGDIAEAEKIIGKTSSLFQDAAREEVAVGLAQGGKDAEALKMARAMQKSRQATVLTRIAEIQARAERKDAALKTLQEAKDRTRDIQTPGNPGSAVIRRAEVLAGIATVATLVGDAEQTQKILAETETAARALPLIAQRYEALSWIGIGWARIGDADPAYVPEAERVARDIPDVAAKARIQLAIARTYRQQREEAKMNQALLTASGYVERLPEQPWEKKADVAAELIAANMACGKPTEANELINRIAGRGENAYRWEPYQRMRALATIVMKLPAGSGEDATKIATPR
jgi:tetratricopeptide (TPR) repeat protein